VRRAARHQGFFPLGLDRPEQLAEVLGDLKALPPGLRRDPTEPYDVCRPETISAAGRCRRHRVAG
jgi:hypothetical protein